MANFTDALIYAQQKGVPHLAKDFYQRRQFAEAQESGMLLDEISPIVSNILATHISQPGDFSKSVKMFTKDIFSLGAGDGGATEQLRASTNFDIKQLMKTSTGVSQLEAVMKPSDALAGGVNEEEQDGFIWGNIKRGFENNLGMAKLMSGMLASGVGVDSLGEALKASAQNNFAQAEKFAKSESFDEDPLSWAGQVILEGVPDIAMTLLSAGTAGLAVGGAKMLGGNAAKKAVREGLEASLKKGLVGEGAEAVAKATVKDEVVDAVTSVGLKDAFMAKGRKAYVDNVLKVAKKSGAEFDEDMLKDFVLKGARSRALTSSSTAAMAGGFTWGALTTDGDIAKDLYDEAANLRQARVEQLLQSIPAERRTEAQLAKANEQAKKEISDPTLGDMGVAALVAPLTDSIVPYMVGKQLGIFKGSKVSTVLREMGKTDAGKKMLRSLPAAVARGAIPEGFTEMAQGAMAESAKYDFIKQYETQGLTKEQAMSWAYYMLRPEAKARYLTEFAGGALMGGVLGGIASKFEKAPAAEGEPEAPAVVTPEEAAFLADPNNWIDNINQIFGEGEKPAWSEKAQEMATKGAAIKTERDEQMKPTEAQQGAIAALEADRKKIETKKGKKYTEEKRAEDLAAIDQKIESEKTKIAGANDKLLQLQAAEIDLEAQVAEETLPEAKKILQTKLDATKNAIAIEKIKRIELDRTEGYFEPLKPLMEKIKKTKERTDLTEEEKTGLVNAYTGELKTKIAGLDTEMAMKETAKKEADRVDDLNNRKDFLEPEESVELQFYNFKSKPGITPSTAALLAFESSPENTPEFIFKQISEADLTAATKEGGKITPEKVQAIREKFAPPAETETLTQEEKDRMLIDKAMGPGAYDKMIPEARAEKLAEIRANIQGSIDATKTAPEAPKATTDAYTDYLTLTDDGMSESEAASQVFAQYGEDTPQDVIDTMSDDDLNKVAKEYPETFDAVSKVRRARVAKTRFTPKTKVGGAGVATPEAPKRNTKSPQEIWNSGGLITKDGKEIKNVSVSRAELRKLAKESGGDGQGHAGEYLAKFGEDWENAPEIWAQYQSDLKALEDFEAGRKVVELPKAERATATETQITQEEPDEVASDRGTAEAKRRAQKAADERATAEAEEVVKLLDTLMVASSSTMYTPDETMKAKENFINALKKLGFRNRIATNLQPNEILQALVEKDVLEVSNAQISFLANMIENQEGEGAQFARPVGDQQVSKGTTIEALKTWLDGNKPAFLANAKVEVVTTDKFPDGGKDWQGAYSNGTIYINADTMTEAEMKKILFHESLGHAVARTILGKDYDGAMKTIISEMKKVLVGGKDVMIGDTSLKALLKTYEDKLYKNGEIDPLVAEEVWAKYIEAHVEGKLKNRNLFFRILEKLREMFRQFRGNEVSRLSTVEALAARAVRLAELNALDMTSIMSPEVRAANFQKWFDGSKVVGEDGKPLVMYHGTVSNFTETDGTAMWGTPSIEHAEMYSGGNATSYGSIGENIMPIYLSIKKPFDADSLPKQTTVSEFANELAKQGSTDLDKKKMLANIRKLRSMDLNKKDNPKHGILDFWYKTEQFFGPEGWDVIKEMIKDAGFDGIKLTELKNTTYAALDSNQVKSATGNNGEFDPANPDIRYARKVNPEDPKLTKQRGERIYNKDVQDGVRLFTIAVPKMLETQVAYMKDAFKRDDLNIVDRFLQAKQWAYEKAEQLGIPELKQMFKVAVDASDRRREINNTLSVMARPFITASREDQNAVGKVITQGDIEGKTYTNAAEAKLTEQQFKQYQAIRKTLDESRNIQVEGIQKVVDLLKSKIANQEAANPNITKQIKELTATIGALKSIKGFFPRVRPEGAEYQVTYIENGKLHSVLVEGKGEAGRAAAKRLMNELEARGIKDVGEGKKEGDLTDKTYLTRGVDLKFWEADDMTTRDIADISSILGSVLRGEDGKLPPGYDEMIKSLFFSKGFQKHYLRRTKVSLGDAARGSSLEASVVGGVVDPSTSVIHGYKTTDHADVLRDYIDNLAGYISKAETNEKLFEIFETQKDGKKVFERTNRETLGAYKEARELIKNMNQKHDTIYRTTRFINAMQFHAHIGLRVGSAIWNKTHIHIAGAGSLHTEMKKAGKKDMPSMLNLSKQFMANDISAMKFQIAMSKKPAGDTEAKVTLSEMGWGQEKAKLLDAMNAYFRTAQGTTLSEQIWGDQVARQDGIPKSMWGWYKKASGFFMHHSEISNKLASFMTHYDNMGGNAKDAAYFVRLLNGSYEDFNMPGYLTGSGLSGAAFKIMLNTFRTHVVNYYGLLGNMWKHDPAAFAYTMAAATLMAGVPGKELFEQLVKLIYGVAGENDPFKGSIDTWMEDQFGSSMAKGIKGGMFNWTDITDPSMTIGISAHPLYEGFKVLLGQGSETALAAPFTGFYKAATGQVPFYKIVPIRGLQATYQAFYESDAFGFGTQVEVGARRVFNSDGTPMKLAPWEAAMVAAGVAPAHRSRVGSSIYEGSQVNQFWNDWKTSILTDAEEAKTAVERMKVNAQMSEFNKALGEALQSPAYKGVIRAKPVRWADTKRSRGKVTMKEEQE